MQLEAAHRWGRDSKLQDGNIPDIGMQQQPAIGRGDRRETTDVRTLQGPRHRRPGK
jgi:hypothetical protein